LCKEKQKEKNPNQATDSSEDYFKTKYKVEMEKILSSGLKAQPFVVEQDRSLFKTLGHIQVKAITRL